MAGVLSQNFDPFADDFSFMLAAYHGAATLLSNPQYLDKAAGILVS